MMALRTKLYFVAAIPAALSAALFYLAANENGGDAKFLFRIGLSAAIGGFLFCVVTWDLHRVGELEDDLAFATARANAADLRADEAEARIDELEERLSRIEDDLKCRTMAKKLWTGADEAQLRALFQPEDN